MWILGVSVFAICLFSNTQVDVVWGKLSWLSATVLLKWCDNFMFSFVNSTNIRSVVWTLSFSFPFHIYNILLCLSCFFCSCHSKEAKICRVSQQKSSLSSFKNSKKGFLTDSKWRFFFVLLHLFIFQTNIWGEIFIYVMKFPCFKSLKSLDLRCFHPHYGCWIIETGQLWIWPRSQKPWLFKVPWNGTMKLSTKSTLNSWKTRFSHWHTEPNGSSLHLLMFRSWNQRRDFSH